MYSVSRISSTFNIKDEDFITTNSNYLIVKQNKVKVENYLEYEKLDGINYIIPGNSQVSFKLLVDDYYQTNSSYYNLSGSLSDISMIADSDIILGKYPENNNEIVVDKLAITRLLNSDSTLKMSGIIDYKDLLNRTVSINNMQDFIIVGISDLKSPSIYTSSNNFINILYNSTDGYSEVKTTIDYELYKDKIELKKGRVPSNDYEVLVNISNKDVMPLNKEINVKMNGKKLKVVGYYDSVYTEDYYLVNNNTIKYELISTKSDITIYSSDKEKTMNDFRELDVNIKDSYQSDKNDYKESVSESNRNTLIVSGIMLLISLIEMFLMSRSSFLSRIREIGILRAIGVKRIDIYKMFYGEIFAITTISSVPGIIFMSYVLKVLSSVNFISSLFVINVFTVLISIILVYIFNLIVGLLPVFNIVRKTPANILARHDLD